MTLLAEAEEVCGTHSHHLSDFLKSLGILYVTQGREREAEVALARMDRLRNCRSPKVTLISDLERLIPAQLAVHHYADAYKNVERLASFEGPSPMLLKWHFQSVGRDNVAASLQGQGGMTSLESTEEEEVIIRRVMHDDALSVAVQQNASCASTVSPEKPSVFSEPLREAIIDPALTYYFTIADVCSSSRLIEQGVGPRRFLATPGILTCISIFAWAPPTVHGSLGIAVAAHINLGAVVHGVRCCMMTGQDFDRALSPLSCELRRSFHGLNPASVRVTLVGGHRIMDREPALKAMLCQTLQEGGNSEIAFPLSNFSRGSIIADDDPRQYFSWYLRAACDAAGLDRASFDTTLLNIFEGELCVDLETEVRLRLSNQRFECAALDTLTGCVITHTRFVEPGDREQLMTSEERDRQIARYNELPACSNFLRLTPPHLTTL